MKRWWRRRSLRGRLMIIGAGGMTLGLYVGGAALLAVLGVVQQRWIDAEIDTTARHVASMLVDNSLPDPIPVPAGDQVQVIDAQGRVVATSADADRLVPILSPEHLARVRAGERLTIHGGPSRIASGPLRVTGVVVGPPGDERTVVVARSTVDAMRGIGLLRTVLLIIFPLLLVIAGVVAWRVISATLRPVEQLRRGAEEITGAAGAARLPVPATRHDEIHRLAVTLNGMLDRLESVRARQREFVADAAHELRSPLANIQAQLEVAARLGPDADWPAVAQDVLTDTTRLSRLVDDLLLLARADAAPRPARMAPVELTQLARDVAAGAGAHVVSDAPVWTVGSADELRRMIANLVENAVRYARTRVEVATSQQGERAVLTVTDDGPGIPPAERERVFERFTRLDDSRTVDTGGAGLGLAIVRELVRRHGGIVALADADPAAEPPGLRVEVRLPALDGRTPA